jgi:GT2 family glycosyltransferase
MTVYVVIPVHDRIEHTIRCLESLAAQTHPQLICIVVDGGSTDSTAELVRSRYPDVVLIEGNESWWWTAATNAGVRYALAHGSDDDTVLTLNNDVVVEPAYVRALAEVAEANAGALIGSVAIDSRDRQTIVDGGARVNWLTAKMLPASPDAQGMASVDVLSGRGMLVPLFVYREVGLYDEARLPQYGADYEFSRRAHRAGYGLLVSWRCRVFADLSATGLTTRLGRIKWGDFARSLVSRRSASSLWYRWQYARLAAPWYIGAWYYGVDSVRVIAGGVRNQLRPGGRSM